MKELKTIQEYILKMRELSTNGQIDDAALIHYVIKGFNDKPENKSVLYGRKDLFEFKEKLEVYEIIPRNSARVKNAFDRPKTTCDFNAKSNSFGKVKYDEI